MKVNSITAIQSSYSGNNRKNPNFGARFTMKNDVLKYVVTKALFEGKDLQVEKTKWSDLLSHVTKKLAPMNPQDAKVSLDIARTRTGQPLLNDEAELLFSVPKTGSSVLTKNIGDLFNNNLEDVIIRSSEWYLKVLDRL